MRYRLTESEIARGHRIVNGRPHGFEWEPRFEVTFSFRSTQAREMFIDRVKLTAPVEALPEESTDAL